MSIRSLVTKVIPKETRFRCYKLESAGSSFSYFDSVDFTLIEARIPADNALEDEMEKCNITRIDNLHITSWDQDHCTLGDLNIILDNYKPRKIEYPGYAPETDSAKDCLAKIKEYESERKRLSQKINVVSITPEYIGSLNPASKYHYKNILFHPKTIWPKANDNSTIKLFRKGMFNVLSLGDVEHEQIGAIIKNSKKAKETDILILPHHGAESDILTRDFLRTITPKIAVCSSNYGNKHDHPRKEVRNLLSDMGIPLFTTKSNNVLIKSIGNHVADFEVVELNSEHEEVISDEKQKYRSKKYDALK